MGSVRVINIKKNWPTSDRVLDILEWELVKARSEGVKAVKLIHGYGSTGVGGAIKKATRNYLAREKKAGRIREFVPGERWICYEQPALSVLEACPDLSHDSDLRTGYNEGITIVLL
ncbi:MAG: Smr/MutS family protein [Chitinophagales bacterium]